MSGLRVVIVGQGYVGLPLAMGAAGAGHQVWGVDLDETRVHQLNSGRSPVGDVPDADLAAQLESGRYRATASFEPVSQAEVVVLCVPTPYHNDAPDLSHVEEAGRRLGRHLADGTLVILESTTYPGTTEEFLAPVIEKASGLVAGRDFQLAFSPERIDPGNPKFGLQNTPKIVGGTTPEATALARAFYGAFVDEVVPVSGPKAAEMAKLLENTFRHINIALVNELAILSRDLGVDIWEVIDAAATKPFGFMPFYPGPGVGGHCIPVDPMYLSWRVRQFGGAAKFIELARDVNAAMPLYVVSRIQDLLNDRERALKGSQVLLVGVAYKPNVSDLRESPALPLIEGLIEKGCIVEYHDPLVPQLRIGDMQMTSAAFTESVVRNTDIAVLVTPHEAIDLHALGRWAPLVYDTRSAVPSGPNVFKL